MFKYYLSANIGNNFITNKVITNKTLISGFSVHLRFSKQLGGRPAKVRGLHQAFCRGVAAGRLNQKRPEDRIGKLKMLMWQVPAHAGLPAGRL